MIAALDGSGDFNSVQEAINSISKVVQKQL
jgi:hypothetical protein